MPAPTFPPVTIPTPPSHVVIPGSSTLRNSFGGVRLLYSLLLSTQGKYEMDRTGATMMFVYNDFLSQQVPVSTTSCYNDFLLQRFPIATISCLLPLVFVAIVSSLLIFARSVGNATSSRILINIPTPASSIYSSFMVV